MPLISVAVPIPFLDLLTYHVPDHLALPPVGARVRVPVGSRVVTGCVAAHDAQIDDGTEAKDVVEILDREPFLPPAVVDLCRWVADYYMAGTGDAITVAMPPGAQTRASGFKTRRVVSATAHGLELARLQASSHPAPGSDPAVGSDRDNTNPGRLKPAATYAGAGSAGP